MRWLGVHASSEESSRLSRADDAAPAAFEAYLQANGRVAFLLMRMLSARLRDQFGPFEPWFFYGIALVELVMMSAFIVAVIQSILHRRALHDHAWWLISTVFIIMMPSLGRGVGVLWANIFGSSDRGQLTWAIYITTAVILLLLFWAARRYGRFNHPATWLALGVNLFNLLFEPLGKWEWLQGVLTAAIKG